MYILSVRFDNGHGGSREEQFAINVFEAKDVIEKLENYLKTEYDTVFYKILCWEYLPDCNLI